ncbi:MAG: hypothetical protein ACREA7_08645 [Nitrosotalea sp.]
MKNLGLLITALFLLLAVPLLIHNVNAATPQLTFGLLGSGPGQLHLPRGIAVDNSGNIYVADNRNHRVEAFDPLGKFVSEFDKGGIPEGIAVDGSGNIIVVDRSNMTVKKFSPGGVLLSSFGSAGSEPGQLGNAARVAIDSSGDIYVTDANTVEKFNSNGSFVSYFFANDTKNCCMNAMGIASDDSNNVYVADMFYHRIIKFNSTGSILLSFNSTLSRQQAMSPQDVAVDPIGNIYVADTGNGRIVKFNSTGAPISSLDISGVPVGIAIDKSGKIYVTDLANNRVDVFTMSQFGNTIPSTVPQRKEIPLNQNSTALDAAIKLATSSPKFQSLVQGYNYTFNSDFEESGPLSKGGTGLTAHGFAFDLYSGPVKPGSAVKVVEVLEDPTFAKILNVTSYQAVYNYGGAPTTPANSTLQHAKSNTLLSPLEQFKSGVVPIEVKCPENFVLTIKSEDDSPACVKPDTVQKLIERGWAKEPDSNPNSNSEKNQVENEDINKSQSVKLSATGFNGTYKVGEPIDFKINESGYGFACPVPHLRIIKPDLTVYWQGRYPVKTCSSTLGEFDQTYDLSMFGRPVMNQSGDYVFEISYQNKSLDLPFLVLPDEYKPTSTKLWGHASEIICNAVDMPCSPGKTFEGQSVGRDFYATTVERNGTNYKIFLGYPIWCILTNSSGASCAIDSGIRLEQAHGPPTGLTCNGTAVPPGDYKSGLVPVLTMRPNSTAKVCITYEFVQDWSSYPIKDVYPFGIFELGGLDIGHIGSATSSHGFAGTAEPSWVDIANVTAGSKLSVLYTIKADANSTGYYDSSVPYGLCSRYPLAVGYSTMHISKSDFSSLLLLPPPCFNSIEKIDSVDIVSGMNYTVVDFG